MPPPTYEELEVWHSRLAHENWRLKRENHNLVKRMRAMEAAVFRVYASDAANNIIVRMAIRPLVDRISVKRWRELEGK